MIRMNTTPSHPQIKIFGLKCSLSGWGMGSRQTSHAIRGLNLSAPTLRPPEGPTESSPLSNDQSCSGKEALGKASTTGSWSFLAGGRVCRWGWGMAPPDPSGKGPLAPSSPRCWPICLFYLFFLSCNLCNKTVPVRWGAPSEFRESCRHTIQPAQVSWEPRNLCVVSVSTEALCL